MDSTSSYIKRNYRELENFAIITADNQTNGHGRNNKKWFNNDKEDLLLSILIKDKEIIEQYYKISLFMSTIVYEFLKNNHINDISIKWPNDVYVNDKKISGILLEGISTSNSMEAIIIGVGINVNSKDFIGDYKVPPTSIYNEMGMTFDIENLRNDFIEILLSKLRQLTNNNSFINVVRDNNYLVNKKVYINYQNKKTLVEPLDINDDCSLKVLMGDNVVDIISGEISVEL